MPRKKKQEDDRPILEELERLDRFGDRAVADPSLGKEEVVSPKSKPVNAENPFSLSHDEIEEIMKADGPNSVRESTKWKLLQQAEVLKTQRNKGEKLSPAIKTWIERFYKVFTDQEMATLFGCNISSIDSFRERKNLFKGSDKVGKNSVTKQLLRLGRPGVNSKIVERIVGYKKSTRYYKQKEVLTPDEWIWFDDQFTEMAADFCEEGDLTRQEINAVTDLTLEYLNQFRINKRLRFLAQVEEQGVENLEERKLVENTLNNSIDRSQKMLRDLKATRRQRLEKSQPRKISIIDLVEAWKKEETRGFLLQRAKIAQEQMQSEFERLKDPRIGMAMILGYDPTKRVINIDEEFGEEKEVPLEDD